MVTQAIRAAVCKAHGKAGANREGIEVAIRAAARLHPLLRLQALGQEVHWTKLRSFSGFRYSLGVHALGFST